MKDKLVLAIDTALGGCCIGLYDPSRGRVLNRVEPMAYGQAEHLLPLLLAALKELDAGMGDLGAIICMTGPGAFTGLRIGLSSARALSLSLNVPGYGLSNFQALALAYVDNNPGHSPFAVTIDTKREEFYVQTFLPDGTATSVPRLITSLQMREELSPGTVIIGDGVARLHALMPERSYDTDYHLSDCGLIARLFCDVRHRHLFSEDLSPLYLRAPDTTQPKSAPRTFEPGKLSG